MGALISKFTKVVNTNSVNLITDKISVKDYPRKKNELYRVWCASVTVHIDHCSYRSDTPN